MNAHLARMIRLWHLVVSLDFQPLRYALWTRWRGLDLSAQGSEELGLSSARAKAHAASGGPLLEKVLSALEIPGGRRIVDLGSGKGGAAITLSRYFTEVLGVELSPELVKIAEANARKLHLTNVRFVCGDAALFTDLHQFDVVYMFNPFPQVVMAEVAGNLQKASLEYGRPDIVIYKNPLLEEELLTTGWHKHREFTFRDSRPYAIYRRVPGPGTGLEPEK